MSTQNYQEERIIDCGDAYIHYHLERKNVRNLNLRIHRDGSIYISAHPDISLSEIEEFVCRKKAYILSTKAEFENLRQFSPQSKHYVSDETFNILGRGLRLEVSRGSKNKIVSDGVFLHLAIWEPDDENFRKRKILNSTFTGNAEKTLENLSINCPLSCRNMMSPCRNYTFAIWKCDGVPVRRTAKQ